MYTRKHASASSSAYGTLHQERVVLMGTGMGMSMGMSMGMGMDMGKRMGMDMGKVWV